ncbi:hypothetical protein N6B72_06965 [Chryseobacterium soli]|uniref:Uncharacterized protein n=1 Tax=Chryseobacterium soli TaxID=445961 RepID=A0A086AC94_9FLAO|nr:hypothetical protein [Chryseobacterium soli]KFF14308.1 hypothetical protein IW15_02370 [Chryseobacterium soli]MDV7696654.1 hypothetical protein [Chryseobacterium soli]
MTKIDTYIVISITNFILFFTVVYNTVLNFFWFVSIIILLCVIINLLINKGFIKIGNLGKKYFFLVLFPLMINIFFLINYLTGTKPTKETYCFRGQVSYVGGAHSREVGKTTYIFLSNDAYAYEYNIRSFFTDYKRMLFKNQVTYTFERGIFGFKVRKDYQFFFNENCLY